MLQSAGQMLCSILMDLHLQTNRFMYVFVFLLENNTGFLLWLKAASSSLREHWERILNKSKDNCRGTLRYALIWTLCCITLHGLDNPKKPYSQPVNVNPGRFECSKWSQQSTALPVQNSAIKMEVKTNAYMINMGKKDWGIINDKTIGAWYR